MTYFRVAHLPLGQSNRQAGRSDGGVRPALCYLIDIRCARQGDCIALFTWIDAPTIHNDQDKGTRPFGRCCTHVLTLHTCITKLRGNTMIVRCIPARWLPLYTT